MDYPAYKKIRITIKDNVAVIELNNPPVNAFSDEMIAEMTDLFTRLREDGDVKVGRLSSTQNVYCAGADLPWMKSMIEVGTKANEESALRMAEMFEAMKDFHEAKALINIVQGAAMGGGAGFAAIGYVVAEENGEIKKEGKAPIKTGARGAYTEIGLGILPGVIAWHVMRKIGPENARNLFSTAEEFDAELGKKIGLFDEVIPKAGIMARADELVGIVLAQGKNGLPPRKEHRPVEELKKAENAAEILKDKDVTKAGHLPEALERLNRLIEGIQARLEKVSPDERLEAMTFASQLIAEARVSQPGQVGIGGFVKAQEEAAKARAAKEAKPEKVVPITAATGRKVTVFEMAPRDGFQSLWGKDSTDKDLIPVRDKVGFIRDLLLAGVRKVEVGAYVNPKVSPQMANTSEVVKELLALERVHPDVRFSVLVPNEKGLQAALVDGISPPNWEIAIFTSASEAMEQANLNRSIADSLKAYGPVIELAKKTGIPVRAYVSAFCGCPITGKEVPVEEVIRVTQELFKLGDGYVYQVSLGDTTGVGHPKQVTELLGRMKEAGIPIERLAGHFHDTWGAGIANVQAAVDAGINTIDSSAGGIGGCVVVRGATGNVGTEDVNHLLTRQGIETGIDQEKLVQASGKALDKLGIESPSRVHGTLKRQAALVSRRGGG